MRVEGRGPVFSNADYGNDPNVKKAANDLVHSSLWRGWSRYMYDGPVCLFNYDPGQPSISPSAHDLEMARRLCDLGKNLKTTSDTSNLATQMKKFFDTPTPDGLTIGGQLEEFMKSGMGFGDFTTMADQLKAATATTKTLPRDVWHGFIDAVNIYDHGSRYPV